MTAINVILEIKTLDDTLRLIDWGNDWGNCLSFHAIDDDGEIELDYDVKNVIILRDALNKWLESRG